MSNISPLLERNKEFARTGVHIGLAPVPKYKVFVVTCMDGRVDPAHILGVDSGDALVMRNAGGRVTDEVIREVAFIATLTETLFAEDAPRSRSPSSITPAAAAASSRTPTSGAPSPHASTPTKTASPKRP
jgi:hypothetical protein